MNSKASKTVVINFGSGSLSLGFPQITVRLWTDPALPAEQVIGSLPAALEVAEFHRIWQSTYRALCGRFVLRLPPSEAIADELEIDTGGITQVSQQDFEAFSQQLQQKLNTWLKSDGFLNIERRVRSHLNPADEIRVIFEVNDNLLRRLPWNGWDFFQHYPNAEMALSRPEYKRREIRRDQVSRKKVRILAILGDCRGIDAELERQALQNLADAETRLLIAPTRQEFNDQLWDADGWDMLFFAGHSQTEGETGRIYINENSVNHSLTIDQLEAALSTAIENGLRLAIFNSCDGIGLAQALGKLQIPQVIVMREPVPNRVAQEFLHCFLEAFAIRQLPLYLATRQAREKLQGLEDEFPGVSWLPVICQNPAVEPSTWLQLGGTPPCPYRGLFAFQEADAHLFFGRQQFTHDLVTAVTRKAFVAVVGPSGSGKSSVVFAGLVPHLRHKPGTTHWQMISFRPGVRPFDSLAEALIEAFSKAKQPACLEPAQFSQNDDPQFRFNVLELAVELQQTPQTLCQMIARLYQENPGTRRLLIVDQFEELYTLCPEAERQPFLDELLDAVQSAPAFTLLLTLRADFYGYALTDRSLSDALQGAVYNLGPMSREELQQAIVQPSAQMQVQLESGLTDKLIQSTWGQAGRLPLLEFALTELWSQQQAGWLTHQAYDAIGGVEESLANHAERVYAQLHSVDQQRVQRIFVQLVEPGVGTDASRRLATRDEVGETNWDLVSHLASSRLVVTNRSETTGEETVEIVHEALIRNWGRLASWLQMDDEFRRWQEDLRRARRQWEKSDREDESLLRGKRLADAEYWYGTRQTELSIGEQQFIQLSLKLRDRTIQQHRQKRHLLISGLLIGLLCTSLLAGSAWWQSQRSTLSEVRALSTSSASLFASNKRLDALVESLRSWNQMHQVVWVDSETRDQVQLVLQQTIFGANEQNRLSGHTDVVYGVAFSPDGQLIATASNDTTIKLWKLDGTLVKTFTGNQSGVVDVQFSPDSQVVATASIDGMVRLWNQDGSLRTAFKASNFAVHHIAFNPDGQLIATASNNGVVKLWTQKGLLTRKIEAHSGSAYDVAFSPDGQWIVTAGADGTLKLWNLDGTLIQSLSGHQGAVFGVALSPNGQLIASAGADQTIRLWRSDGTFVRSLSGHTGKIYSIAFSQDNQFIESASGDGTVKLWRRDGTLVETFSGQNGELWAVAFSPDGRTILSGSSSGTVQLWHRDNGLLKPLNGHTDRVDSVAFSPDGQLIASAGKDKTVILWQPDGTRLNTLTGHTAEIRNVTFSADSRLMASSSDDRTVRVWQRNSAAVTVLSKHPGIVYGAAFSPDGHLLASASTKGKITLWRVEGTLWKTISAHDDDVWGIAFSPDGQIIASASRDKTIKLWRRDGTLFKTLKGHQAAVSAVTFSPDGKSIASASWDRTVKLWNLDGTVIKTLTGHNDRVETVAFSSDGKFIASGGDDQTIKLWKRDGTLLNTLKGHRGVILGLTFSPDGRILASASMDKTVLLWNVPQASDPHQILVEGCKWVSNYLKTNLELGERDRHLCDNVEQQ